MPSPAELARAMHGVVEPLHAILYFADEAREELAALGLEPLAQGYLAGRAAPLGPVGPEVVTATFYNFAPALVHMGIPGAWDIATPEAVIAARTRAMERFYARIDLPTDDLDETIELASDAVASADLVGRPLAAANAGVALPGTPFGDLFQLLTVLREHRGDGHVALLTAHAIGPVEALVLYTSWHETPSRRFYERSRLWDEDAWQAAEATVRQRGWLDADGLTSEGRAFRDELEHRTDELASAPYAGLGEQRTRRLFRLLHPLAVRLDDAEVYKRRLELPPLDTLG